MRLTPLVLAGVLAIAACGTTGPGYRDDRVTIASNANFDPARFAGRWHEIARYPNARQQGCAGATSEFVLAGESTLTLRTACLSEEGTEIGAETGRAALVGPGRLSVRLDGRAGAIPYWILWVDEGYRTAVVAQPDGRAGWILNRDPEIPRDRWIAAREILDFNGFDLARLVPGEMP